MNRFIVLSLGVLMLSITAGAQAQEESWDNLRSLRAGEKIQVVDQKLKSQTGTFVSVSDEAISLRVNQDEISVQRADVLRVSSSEGMGRGKHTLIGLAVGGVGGLDDVGVEPGVSGAGAVLIEAPRGQRGRGDAAKGAGQRPDTLHEPNEGLKDPAFLPAFIGLGAGIRAGIGAALPAGRPTIYREASP